ncbi:MAG TPA: insulinase family protein [Geminicoccaceae bacterium]|mgnify:CR=1 FL=1|nr:insulinase family protein [Geminicoccus sp.]HMU48372.1 insulinase family protein [Geminicoccaceae bacterium]
MTSWMRKSARPAVWLAAMLALIPIQLRAADLPPWPVPADGVLAHDPSVVWGRLANGLRYAIMPNQTPPGRVSLRLLVEAGSLMEADDQRGLAHFLEHMAFKGSENLAPGDLVHYMQRAGLAFGADTNAATGYDTTSYRLDLPRNDAGLIGEGLGILSEIEGRLTLDPAQIEPERGVILSEKRARDTPRSRFRDQMLEFLLPGSRQVARDPIGIEDVIRTAPRERFAAFYRDYYTPERSVVIVTGDVAPAAVARAIEERFGGFTQPADAPGDPSYPPLAERGLDAILVSDPGLTPTVSLYRVLPYVDRPDSIAEQQRLWREMFAGSILGRRLDLIGLQAGAPFSGAGAGVSDLPPTARLATVQVTTTPETWKAALTVVEQELRRALTFGVSQVEIDEIAASFRSRLQALAAGQSTRETPELAEQLVDVVADENVFSTPATDLKLFEQMVAGLTPADIDATLRELWGGGPPQIVVGGPMKLADARAEILQVYDEAAKAPVTAGEARAAAAFAYEGFGEPGEVVATEEVADLGITRVTFANGVKLDLKPSELQAGRVHVAVRFGSGRIGMPEDKPGLDLLAGRGFVEGGLGRQSLADLTPLLASRQVEIDLTVSDASLVMMGETTPDDLPLQLGLLAAYVTDPGYRPEAMDRYRQSIASTYARLDTVPSGTLSGPVQRLLHDGDARFGLPERADAEARTLDELRAWMEPMLRQGPMQVSIVGDIATDRAIAEVARTFGALPARGEVAAVEPPRDMRVPESREPVRFTHHGPVGQAVVAVYWPSADRSDPAVDTGLDLVADILDDRLLDAVRVRAGATYSPEAYNDASLVIPGYGVLGAILDVPAADAESLAALIRDTAAGIAKGGITEDELDRAKQPRLSRARSAFQNNEYWLRGVLVGLNQFPQLLDDARNLVGNVERQDLASVQALATRYLDPAKALTVLVLPADTAASGG